MIHRIFGLRAKARMLMLCLALTLALPGCSSDETAFDATGDVRDANAPQPRFEPAGGSVSGYYPVTIRLAELGIDAASVRSIRFGGISAYDLVSQADGSLRAIVQGHPDGGPVEVELEMADQVITLDQPFVYQGHPDPRFARVVGFGASLSQGIQRCVPTHDGALMGPFAQMARHIGFYLPLPLLVRGLFPEVGVQDVGPPPLCIMPNTYPVMQMAVTDMVQKLYDPVEGVHSYAMGRVDPHIQPRLFATGNTSIGEFLNGVSDSNLGGAVLGHLVYEPLAGLFDPLTTTQLEHVLAASPTILMTADCFGNDLLWGILLGKTIDPAYSTPVEVLIPQIVQTVDTLAATGAEVFMANLPGTSLLPVTAERRAQALVDGILDIDDRIAAIDEIGLQANAALADAAARHPNVHIVDVHGWAARIATDGLHIGGGVLGPRKFGGLVGLDGVHFTSTGYAALANLFLEAMNEVLGTDFPPIDAEAVAATDFEQPSALMQTVLAACD